MKVTPLHSVYADRAGTRLVDFSGWEMPIQFAGGILAEHNAVRRHAGLFDVSHMGELFVQGRDSEAFLDYLLTNRVAQVGPGRCLYTPMCRQNGSTVDDLLVYVLEPSRYLLVVNAANIEKDYQWILSVLESGRWEAEVNNASDEWALLALQGPDSRCILRSLTVSFDPCDLVYYHHKMDCRIDSIPVLISRTGYTGEDGFELYSRTADAPSLWKALEAASAVPCGLGARDLLRLEAALPLYGHELTDSISPLEAGLAPFVKLDKDEFIGKTVLQSQKTDGIPRRVFGLEMIDAGVAREGCEVYAACGGSSQAELPVGSITSGGKSPERGAFIALAILENSGLKIGDAVEVDIRGKRKKARIVKKPFYKRMR